jgi:hypothetical protein
MEEGQEAWIKGEKKNTGSAEISGFRRQVGAILSTFWREATHTSSFPALPTIVEDGEPGEATPNRWAKLGDR